MVMWTCGSASRRIIAVLICCAAIGCSGWLDPNSGDLVLPPSKSYRLTDAQIAAITHRTSRLAQYRPDLAWLADTLTLTLQVQRELLEQEVKTDFGTGPFYTVGLLRQWVTTTGKWSAYDVVLLNNPSNPTDFIILHGAAIAQEKAPNPIGGTLTGSPAVARATFFQFDGDALTVWRGVAGTVTVEETPSLRLFPGRCDQSVIAVPPDIECFEFYSGTSSFDVATVSEGGGNPGKQGPSASGQVYFQALFLRPK